MYHWCALVYLVNLTYVYRSTDRSRTWFMTSTRLHNIINVPIYTIWSRALEYKYYMKPKISTDIPRDTGSPVKFLFTFKFKYYDDRKSSSYNVYNILLRPGLEPCYLFPSFRRTVKTITLHIIGIREYIILRRTKK